MKAITSIFALVFISLFSVIASANAFAATHPNTQNSAQTHLAHHIIAPGEQNSMVTTFINTQPPKSDA